MGLICVPGDLIAMHTSPSSYQTSEETRIKYAFSRIYWLQSFISKLSNPLVRDPLYLLGMANLILKKGSSKKIPIYERRAYKLVDDRSLS